MAQMKTKSASPVHTVHFEVTHVSSPEKVTREGFTVRTDKKVLRGYSFKMDDGKWIPLKKVLWKSLKELPESLGTFQVTLEKALTKMGYSIVKVLKSETH